MPNLIFRGPNPDEQPRTQSAKPVAAAGYLPGTWVTEGATSLTQATTAAVGNLRVLSNRDYLSTDHMTGGDPLMTPYAANETATAYIPEPGHQYQCAMAAATYTYGQELTVAAAGRLAAAAAGNVVVATFTGTPGTLAAGALADVEITNHYAKA